MALPILNATFVCVAILSIIVASALRTNRWRRRQDLVTAIAYLAFSAIGAQIQAAFTLIGVTLDPALLRADRTLGFDPIRFAQAFAHHRFAMAALIFAYLALPVMIGVAWIAEQDSTARRAVILGGLLCFGFYAICPAVGPGHYDWTIHAADGWWRNCMPSMHLAWALLIAWNARSWRLRALLWPYVVIVTTATLATGEHYLVDLLAAIPYTVLIQWSASSISFRSLRSYLRLRNELHELSPKATEAGNDNDKLKIEAQHSQATRRES